MIPLLTNLESFPAAVLAQVTIVLLVAIVIQQSVARSPAARHTVLFWALIAAGFCPLLNCAVRSLGFVPLATASSVPPPDSPSHSENVVASLVADAQNQSSARFSLADMLPVLWLAGSLLASVRLGRGLHVTHKLRRAALPIAGEVPEQVLKRLSTHLGRTPPEILISDRIRVPMAVGCLRTVILLPSTLRPMLDDRQLLQVLIHECAHAVRRDPLVGVYQRLLAAAFWFHPLVRLANGLLDRAREELCDNSVLRSIPPTDYSRTLLAIAESFSLVPNGLLSQTLFQSARHLDHRVAGLLNPRRCTMIRLKIWKVAAVAVAFLTGGGILACFGAPSANRSSGYDLSHIVHFEVGATQFRNGDSVTIDEVHGTSDTITAGNIYVIRGTYRLASEKAAMLAAFTTGNAANPEHEKMQSIPTQKTQTMMVDQGDGQFTLILYLWYDGNPHISFYPAGGGNSFGGVYFGTGSSLLKEASWMK